MIKKHWDVILVVVIFMIALFLMLKLDADYRGHTTKIETSVEQTK